MIASMQICVCLQMGEFILHDYCKNLGGNIGSFSKKHTYIGRNKNIYIGHYTLLVLLSWL